MRNHTIGYRDRKGTSVSFNSQASITVCCSVLRDLNVVEGQVQSGSCGIRVCEDTRAVLGHPISKRKTFDTQVDFHPIPCLNAEHGVFPVAIYHSAGTVHTARRKLQIPATLKCQSFGDC